VKTKILIIDDEVDLCILLKIYLTSKNYEVVTEHTLSKGLAKLESFHPDILFLDNNLPDGLGWEEAFAIAMRFPHLRINLISGIKLAELRFKMIGPNLHIIEKPLSALKIDNALSIAA
jgi:two-component system OmpR family response regulator